MTNFTPEMLAAAKAAESPETLSSRELQEDALEAVSGGIANGRSDLGFPNGTPVKGRYNYCICPGLSHMPQQKWYYGMLEWVDMEYEFRVKCARCGSYFKNNEGGTSFYGDPSKAGFQYAR